MKRALALVPLVVLLAGCTTAPTPDKTPTAEFTPTIGDARANCLAAYEELPHAIETLTIQSGELADTATPCDNWIESQGEAAFVEFWTTPETFIPFVISEGKLEGLAATS